MLPDLKFTWRSLVRRPLFALTAILTLGLGIGINTSVFTLVNAVLLRPLPVRQPERLVEVYTSTPERLGGVTSYPDLLDLRSATSSLSGLAGHSLMFANYTRDGRPELMIGELATANYFDVLGVALQRGRFFDPDADRDGADTRMVVLSDRFWRTRLNADPAVLGQTLPLNGVQYTISGIAARGFDGVFPGLAPAFWIPLRQADAVEPFGQIDTVPSPGTGRFDRRGYRWLFVTGRLADGRTPAEAQGELQSVMARLGSEYPRSNGDRRISVIPTSDVRINPDLDGAILPVSAFLLATVGLVLLVACANVANLFLARASARRREIALRLALGTSRTQLVRQLLLESVAVSLIAGTLGLALSLVGTRLLLAAQPPIPVSIQLNLDPDWRVFGFTLLTAVLTGLVFGLAPALQAVRTNLVTDLKGGHHDESSGHWKVFRNGLVSAQLALSLILLVGAALFVRGLGAARQTDVGFEPDRVALVGFNLSFNGYSAERGKAFYSEVQERLRRLPGVESVTLAERPPFSINTFTTAVYPSATPDPAAKPFTVDNTSVTPGYFDVLKVPIVDGRDFTESDREGSPPVAIVSEAMVQRFWPGDRGVGKQIRTAAGRVFEIVGVSRDYAVRSVGETPRPYIHFARLQAYQPYANVLVRTTGPASAALPLIRRELALLDPDLLPFQLTTLDGEVLVALSAVRAGAAILSGFGALTLILAAVGLYGVLAYSVSRRTREIGTRVAIGASPQRIVLQIVRESGRLFAIGVLAGILGAAAAARLVQSYLYGVSSLDVRAFGGALVLLSLVVLAASAVPAFTASRVDPIVALKTD